MIHMQNLTFGYRKKAKLFQSLNLDLEPGNIYGLLGRNGAGKTTLLKIIAGARFIQGGSCAVFNEKAGQRTPQLLRELFFIPEDFSVPQMRMDIFVSLHAPFYPQFDHAAFNTYVKEFQFQGKEQLGSLSYGQKKKFLIAFGLASNCRLLILDEPTNGLDIPSKSQFRKLVAASISGNKSFIISTHQVRDLETLIDPIVILENGAIIFNHSMLTVSEKLMVSLSKEEPDPAEALYAEKVLGGYTVLEENKNAQESVIDLELLFNAVINNHRKISRLLERKE